MRKRLKKSKDFILVFLMLVGFHVVEDTIWIVAGRFTEIPIWMLVVGVVLVTLVMTKFVRKYHNHGH